MSAMRAAACAALVVALASPTPLLAAPPESTAAATMMPEARFWSIVEVTRKADPGAQIAALKARLAALTPEEIVGFESCLDAQMRRSYRWDLWGAAYVAMGGASDDGFEYFRLWLVARGRADFEKVLADPDALAAIAPADPEQLEFEDFALVPSDVWAAKTGKAWDAMPHLSVFFLPDGYGAPVGTKFSEDPAALAARYPKLWRRFGGGDR
jgi:hypothetical protein